MQGRIKQNINGESYYVYTKDSNKKYIALVVVVIIAIIVGVLAIEGLRSIASSVSGKISSGIENTVTSEEIEVKTVVITEDDVRHQLIPIGELATYEDDFSGTKPIEDYAELWGKNIPLTKHTININYQGVIKAGIEMNKIVIDVDNTNKVIYVTLPDAEILKPTYHTYRVLDEQNNVFNEIKADEVEQKLENEIVPEAEAFSIEHNDLYEKAEANAKKLISNHLKVFEKDGYRVEFTD